MKKREAQFVICVRNKGYPASLELGKAYRLLKDEHMSKHSQVRVIDESGEDYLYPEDYFVPKEFWEGMASAMPRPKLSVRP